LQYFTAKDVNIHHSFEYGGIMNKFIGIGRTLLVATAAAVWSLGCGGGGAVNSGGDNVGVVDPNTVVKGVFTDSRDGQTYKTVKIGSQIWMAENLNVEAEDSWCYENTSDSCAKYGRLYTWAAAKTVCPAGWRLPDITDWRILMTAAGGEESAGKELKSKSGWINYNGVNGNGTDSYGFSALPGGGNSYIYGGFGGVGAIGRWWTPADGIVGDGFGQVVILSCYHDYMDERSDLKGDGLSVRCVKNK
jgi:uncharacterized protein (TIGR02145 family)